MSATVVVVVLSAIGGAFTRSLTGFGGSIMFELVFNCGAQAHLSLDLEDDVLMVALATAFELVTSSVLFVLVFSEACRQWRLLAVLSILSLPATFLGTSILVLSGSDNSVLKTLNVGLNCLFFVVAIYKLTTDLRPGHVSCVDVNKSDPMALFKDLWLDLLMVGFCVGFLSGLIGLPGPVIMVYFATVQSSGRMPLDAGFSVVQCCFMLMTVFRVGTLAHSPVVREIVTSKQELFALVPLPSLLAMLLGHHARRWVDPTTVLRVILGLLLLSSLVGVGVLAASRLGLTLCVIMIIWICCMIVWHATFGRREASSLKDPVLEYHRL